VPQFQLKHLLSHYCTHGRDFGRPADVGDERPRFKRVRLMRHSFRDHKAQLVKLKDWVKELERRPTVEEAYPEDGPAQVSAQTVLNAVRFNPRLAEIVSAEQGSDILDEGDLVLVFASTGGKTAEFLGAYAVREAAPGRKHLDWGEFRARYGDLLRSAPAAMYALGLSQSTMLVEGMGYNSLPSGGTGGCLYNLERREDVLQGLERRLIVEWNSGLSWFQKDLGKQVVEIRPPGFVREFTGYLDFTLSFDELRAIVGVQDESPVKGEKEATRRGDPVWCEKLSAIGGVYLVQSDEQGVYVGSASGKTDDGGFLGRWRTYAKTHEESTGSDDKVGLRENVGMKEFLDAGGDRELQKKRLRGLRFSIAREMSKHAIRRDVEEMERWFKDKLGSRVLGARFNRNY